MLITLETSEVQLYYEGCQRIHLDYMAEHFPTNATGSWNITQGKRYIKVTHNGSVHSFIDTLGGDVLKPAGFAKPARGNIFDDHNGLKDMGPYGPAYLR